ncbi:MAG: UDP-glucose 4-epimerase, partial [Rhodothermales bacterium]
MYLAIANLHAALKDAADNTFLAPDLALGEFAVGDQAGEFGARASAAGRAIVGTTRAHDIASAVCIWIRGRAEELHVIDLAAVVATNACCFEGAADGPRAGFESCDVRELQLESVVVYQEEPVAAPGDVAMHVAESGHIDRHSCSAAIAAHVTDGHASVWKECSGNIANGCFELMFAGADASEMGQCGDDADGAMSAHAEIADVVEKDDARCGLRTARRAEQGADQHIAAAWLEDDSRANGVVRITKALALCCQVAFAQLWPASDDDASGLAARMRINNTYSRHARKIALAEGFAWPVSDSSRTTHSEVRTFEGMDLPPPGRFSLDGDLSTRLSTLGSRMRILITGGSGFIGSHLAQHFQDTAEIVVLDNLHTGFRHNLDGVSARFVEGSILDKALLADAVKGVDYVFHLAALISVPESMAKPHDYVEINTQGTLAVLRAAADAGVKKLCFSTSAANYGNNPTIPKIETMIPEPKSPYAVTKLDGEYYCAMFANEGWLDTACLRYFNVFGPRQDPKGPYAAAVPIFIDRALRNAPITVFGDGDQTRDFIYVKDIAAANAHLAQSAADGVFNVAYGGRVTVKALAERIVRITNSKSEILHAPERAGDVKHSQASVDKLRATG